MKVHLPLRATFVLGCAAAGFTSAHNHRADFDSPKVAPQAGNRTTCQAVILNARVRQHARDLVQDLC